MLPPLVNTHRLDRTAALAERNPATAVAVDFAVVLREADSIAVVAAVTRVECPPEEDSMVAE